jgi:hypothetical protein
MRKGTIPQRWGKIGSIRPEESKTSGNSGRDFRSRQMSSAGGPLLVARGKLPQSHRSKKTTSVRQNRRHSTLSNVRVAAMVCPVREDVSGVVLIVRFGPLISKNRT